MNSSHSVSLALASSLLASLASAQRTAQPPLAHSARPAAVVHVDALPRPMRHAEALAFARAAAPSLAPVAGARAASGTGDRIPLASGVEGDMPRAVAITPDGATLLAACRDTDSVEFFDAATGARIGGVAVGARPVDVEITPDGTTALVACLEGGSLTFVDVQAQAVITDLDLSALGPYEVELDATGTRAVVGAIGGSTLPGALGRFVVVDVASASVSHSFLSLGHSPIGFFQAPWVGAAGLYFADFELIAGGSRVMIADHFAQRVRVYDVATGARVAARSTGAFSPCRIDVSDGGNVGVVSLQRSFLAGAGAIARIDLPSVTLTQIDVSGDVFLSEVRITPDDTRAIVGTIDGIEIVDLTTGSSSALAAGGYVGSIDFTFDDRYAVVSYVTTGIVDLATESIVATPQTRFLQELVTSPVDHRAYGVSFVIDENVSAIGTDGAAGGDLWSVPVGVPEEIDGPYAIGLTPDGRRAVVACPVSENLAFVDLEQRAVLGTLATNGPSHDVAVSPTEDVAVVMQEVSGTVAVVDVAAQQLLVELPLTRLAREVQILDDGSRALVLCTGQTDSSLVVIDLDGAQSTIVAEIPIPGEQRLGFEVTSDGALAALWALIPGRVALVDLNALSLVQDVPVAIFPQTGAFTPDGSKLLLNSADASLTTVTINGSMSSAQSRNLPGRALAIEIDAAGQHAYIVSIVPTGGFDAVMKLLALDISSNQIVARIDVPFTYDHPATHFPYMTQRIGDQLVLAQSDFGEMWRFELAGPATRLIEARPIDGLTYEFSVSSALGTAVFPFSTIVDELQLVDFRGAISSYCGPAVANSSGASAEITAYGTLLAGDQPLRLEASGMPTSTVGFFLVADATGFFQPSNSQGNICLGGNIGRYSATVLNTGASGSFALDVDVTDLPYGPPTAVAPGEHWYFQAWFRDANPGVTSNLSDAIDITFGM